MTIYNQDDYTRYRFNLPIDFLRFGNIRQVDANQIFKPKQSFVTLLCDNLSHRASPCVDRFCPFRAKGNFDRQSWIR